MLERIIALNNIGKFVDCRPDGKADFKKVTLIYGENGRGKTTLAAILRSLTTNTANTLLERRTAGTTSSKIEIKFQDINKPIVFKEDSGWNEYIPGIEIFDSTFINENVYSGSEVSHEHRKNLYHFVVGDEGVNLAQKIELLDDELKNLKTAIIEKGAEIEKLVEWKGDVDKFVALPFVEELDTKIKTSSDKVEILEQASIIEKREQLKPIDLPVFPLSDIESLFEKKVQDLLSAAEIKVKKHINHCMDGGGEAWIQNGLGYIKNNECPFCGQVVGTDELLQAYQDYFSKSYLELKDEIANLQKRIDDYFSASVLLKFQRIFDANEALFNEWGKSGLNLEHNKLKFEKAIELWKRSFELWQALIAEKSEHPLEEIDTKVLNKSKNSFDDISQLITIYCSWVSNCNLKIEIFKKGVEAGGLGDAKNTLKILEATKKRYTKTIDELCKEYSSLVQRRDEALKEKKTAQANLDKFAIDIFDKYQKSINQYLKIFGVGFRLGKISASFAGGKASTSYGLILNDVPVKLSSGAGVCEPSFKNGASEGDKSSLAFAFFLAKLEHEKEIANKIIVMDDPITSLDSNRKNCTKDEILRIIKKAKQVIILSHDPAFLRIIWDSIPNIISDTKTLYVQRKGTDQSTLMQWDIAEATKGDYYIDFFKLVAYQERCEGDPRAVIRAIRPLLEGYYRVRFPRDFPPNKWLGNFIDLIRKSSSSSALYTLKEDLNEINAINDYSKKYHHQENPNAENEPINDTELISFIERTLKLISG